ncbi:MAG: heterodisulfide reductase-related iron-sulfur binding cluster [Dehalococcoidia bacterium]|nr:heterodisulfide reductase-related iron-sulfur binding cluster [Dehalococcoidia bacterium]
MAISPHPNLPPQRGEGASKLGTILQALGPREEDLYKCVHCGLCLNVCPTYLETGLETESPRGRIALMKGVRESRVGLTPRVVGHMELCLQCRACEAVCPSGVPFGRLMEATREQIVQQRKAPWLRRAILRFVFRHLLPHPGRLRFLGNLLRLYQRSPLWWLVQRLPGIQRLQGQIPSLSSSFFRPRVEPFQPQGSKKMRVGLLSGCVMPMAQAATMEAAVRVLTRNGCQVVAPPSQTCCGALNIHGGDGVGAQRMARRNIDAFLDAGVEAVVVASAGCGSTMKEYAHLLRDDPAYADKAKRMSALVVDITELLARLPLTPPHGRLPLRVTYQDPCHLAHAQRITAAPRQLLRAIPGVELVEMENASRCCGAAGLYSALQPQMSRQLGEHKVDAVLATEAQVVATANPGCMMQLQAWLRRAGSGVRVCHVVELLDEAYRQVGEG